jgi:hypothetical protein
MNDVAEVGCPFRDCADVKMNERQSPLVKLDGDVVEDASPESQR